MYKAYQTTKTNYASQRNTINYDECQPFILNQPSYVRDPISKDPDKVNGFVKTYSIEKGFGFLTREDTRTDVFFHRNDITAQPRKGQKAIFKVVHDKRGPKAKEIQFY